MEAKPLPYVANHSQKQSTDYLTDESLICPTPLFRHWYDWHMASAPRPQPFMAMLAAIPTFGIMMGNLYRGPTGLKANPYIVCLADTGEGKDWPRRMGKHLLKSCGRANCIGADVWGSDSGVERELSENNELLWYIDELNPFLRDIKNPNCPAYKNNIVTYMLTMSGGLAHDGKSLKDGEATIKIADPMPSIFACAQPDEFFQMLDDRLVANGFVNRNLIFLGHWIRRVEYGRKPKMLEECMPPELVKHYEDASKSVVNNAAMICGVRKKLFRYSISKEAIAFDKFMHDSCETLRLSSSMNRDSTGKNIVVRSQEKTYRLAMIHAWSKDHTCKEIGADSLEWAWRLCKISDDFIISRCLGTKPVDGKYELNMEHIHKVIKRAGPNGISRSDLIRKCKMPSEMFFDILRMLQVAALVKEDEGKRGFGLRYFAIDTPETEVNYTHITAKSTQTEAQ